MGRFYTTIRSQIMNVGMAGASFSERLLALRSDKRLTQSDMADAVGVSLRFYQRLEGGESEPSLETLQKALTGLNVSYEEFFGLPKAISTWNLSAAADLLNAFAAANVDQQKLVLAILFEKESLTHLRDVSAGGLSRLRSILKSAKPS